MKVENNGQPIQVDIKNATKAEKESWAEEFAEGSEKLKSLLLKMWAKGIATLACCAGHKDKNYEAYISFKVDNLDEEFLTKLLSGIMESYRKQQINFSFQIDKLEDCDNQSNTISISISKKELYDEAIDIFDHIIFSALEEYGLTDFEKQMVETVKDFFELDMVTYLKNSKKAQTHQFQIVQIFSSENKIYIKNYSNLKIKVYREENFRTAVSKGYYTKIKDKYFTVENDKIIEIKEEDLNKYKKLRRYKRYSNFHNFDFEFLNSIINEIKQC